MCISEATIELMDEIPNACNQQECFWLVFNVQETGFVLPEFPDGFAVISSQGSEQPTIKLCLTLEPTSPMVGGLFQAQSSGNF